MSRTSALAKTAALAVTATTLLIFPVAAQQIASNTGRTAPPDYSRCDAMQEANPKGAIICRVEVIQAHTRQLQQEAAIARQQSAEARDEGSCADRIKAEIAAGRIKPEALRAALAGRTAREVGACNLFSMLTRS